VGAVTGHYVATVVVHPTGHNPMEELKYHRPSSIFGHLAPCSYELSALHLVCICMCMCACVCVCVYVCECERERARDRESEREREKVKAS
jgi:hypothetical protein